MLGCSVRTEEVPSDVLGEPLRIITDPQALKWLLPLREPRNRLARSVLEVQAFDLEFEHRSGDHPTMVVADALPTVLEVSKPFVTAEDRAGKFIVNEYGLVCVWRRIGHWYWLRKFAENRFFAIFMSVLSGTGDKEGYNLIRSNVEPMATENAEVLAKVLLEKWFLMFGPPECLLSGGGPVMTATMLTTLCGRLGIFSFGDLGVSSKYNTTEHSSTKMTPYKEMFGVEAFDFGVDFNLAVRQEAEPTREELAEHMEDLHRELYDRSWKAKKATEVSKLGLASWELA
ncbi:hypothetical protein NDN08_000489 [Rhodosorus marinus]|uniref:Uncharacterized protein n=1 Tax=Rhodosorus marinus TaxID=101924 RepID=A0AAV8UQU6_9RHOD|nr:hypothetical protein NDN08_000489 [Rhodosorus marinus]